MAFDKRILIGIAVVVVVIGAIAALGHPAPSLGQTTTILSSGQQTPVLLTDPPIVPTGTTALSIVYSSVRIHTSGTSGSGWINASGSGTTDLLSLFNTSEVIGTASTPPNSTIDMISFNVTSATITINGTTSNVTIPSRSIIAHITGGTAVNATSGVLLDLSPTIAAIYTANSTVFVMVPSVRAIVVGNQNVSSHSSVGAREALNGSSRKSLEDISPNVSIVSSSMSISGNSTDISVSVRDNSNASVLLRHVLIFGNYSVAMAPLAGFNATVHVNDNGNVSAEDNSNAGRNTSATRENRTNATENRSVAGENRGNLVSENGSVTLNLTNIRKSGDNSSSGVGDPSNRSEATHANNSNSESDLISEGIATQHLRMFNFMINQNGAMSLPSLSGEAENEGLGGYNLTAGSTATFTFSGQLSFGDGHITITPTAGSSYRITVSGEDGAKASASMVAN